MRLITARQLLDTTTQLQALKPSWPLGRTGVWLAHWRVGRNAMTEKSQVQLGAMQRCDASARAKISLSCLQQPTGPGLTQQQCRVSILVSAGT